MGNDLEVNFYGNKIKSIQLLRAIAIIFVMIEHVSYWGFGAFGVDIFFVISGFVMMYSTHMEEVTKGYRSGLKTFLPKRLLRIIPLYYVMTVLTYIAIRVFPQFFRGTETDFTQLIKSFLFIPYESAAHTMPIVKVGWCLNYEVLFYLIFFIAILISYKYRGIIAAAALVGMSIAGYLVNTNSIPVRFWLGDVNLDFVYGIFAYYICLTTHKAFLTFKEKKALRVALIIILSAVVCALFALLISGHRIIGDDVTPYRGVSYGIPAFLIFVFVYWIGVLLDIPKFCVWVGDISFSLFLIHYYPVMFFARLGEEVQNSFLRVLLALAGILLAFVLSVPVHYLFDKKISGKIAVFLKKN